MKKLILFLFVLSTSIIAQVNFHDYFLEKTLRLDFYHTGDQKSELISFEKLVEEEFWGGSKKKSYRQIQLWTLYALCI